MDTSLTKLQESVIDREARHAAVDGVAELDMTEGLHNSNLASCTRGKTEETRRTTVPQAHEGKPQSQKANQNEKAKNYIPGEGTSQNRKKNN